MMERWLKESHLMQLNKEGMTRTASSKAARELAEEFGLEITENHQCKPRSYELRKPKLQEETA